MKVVRAAGNGRCLFVSLRLALEAKAIMSASVGASGGLLDGHSAIVLNSAEELCQLICQWYATGLDKEIDAFGSYVNLGRQWCRRDILAIEMVQRGQDIPEEGPGRQKAALDYIERMRLRGTWGSTPEYTAFAFMSKLKVEVYQPQDQQCPETPEEFKKHGLNLINTIVPTNFLGTVRLLYTGHNHYDLLLSNEDHAELKKILPIAI